MYKEHSFKIETHINSDIKVGDEVRLIDGSGLTLKCEYDSPQAKSYHIVYKYPEITGLILILKECNAIVTEINVPNYCAIGALDVVRIQDIVIKIGKAEFRTCSQFVVDITE